MYKFIFFIRIYNEIKSNKEKTTYNRFYNNKIIVRIKKIIRNLIN